jgi:hypothetical protein
MTSSVAAATLKRLLLEEVCSTRRLAILGQSKTPERSVDIGKWKSRQASKQGWG